MKKFMPHALLCIFLLAYGTVGLCATFDERLWEKYAETNSPKANCTDCLVGVYLEPYQFGEITTKVPFVDLRVVTDRKDEVPWQIVSRRPEQQKEALPARIQNLSQTKTGETWLELVLDKQGAQVNSVEIITPDSDFSRPVQVSGSPDGQSWNTLRGDAVIFDVSRGEKTRLTRITFPQTSFRHLALKITNGNAPPLTISDVNVFQESTLPGQTYSLWGTIEKTEINAARKESSLDIHMNTVFSLDRLLIATAERNFQRSVEVQIKRDNGDWQHWAQGTVFNFDTSTMHESQLAIDIPEVATRDFRLIFKNLDSPPLAITSVRGEGYRKLLIFKQPADQKLYLFWGNPLAQQPRYDLAGIVGKQKPDELPIGSLGPSRPNTKFTGNSDRLPFTERYKYLLYVVVAMAIAGLFFVQYRVIRRVEPQ